MTDPDSAIDHADHFDDEEWVAHRAEQEQEDVWAQAILEALDSAYCPVADHQEQEDTP